MHPAVAPGLLLPAVLQKLPTIVPPAFISTLQGWLVQGFADFVKASAQQFLTAADAPLDGVILVFTIDQPSGLKALGKSLGGGASAGSASPPQAGGMASAPAAAPAPASGAPAIRVEARPGHRCD